MYRIPHFENPPKPKALRRICCCTVMLVLTTNQKPNASYIDTDCTYVVFVGRERFPCSIDRLLPCVQVCLFACSLGCLVAYLLALFACVLAVCILRTR